MAAAKKLVSVAPSPSKTTFHDATGGATSTVRFGLYDGAFEPKSVLLNSDTDETKNFVGSDSRRFFIRISDPSSVSPSAKKRRVIGAAWRTYLDDMKTVRDDGKGKPTIALVETKPGSGVFESSWLLLASDPWEVDNVSTTTGRALEGTRTRGKTDFRLRHATVFDLIGVEFPENSGRVTFAPIFQQSPPAAVTAEERRKIPVQIFIMSNIDSPALRAYVLGPDLENMRIVYARLGLWVFTAVDSTQATRPGVVLHTFGAESLLVIPPPPGVTHLTSLPRAEEDIITTTYPGLLVTGASGASPSTAGTACSTDTLRLFYVAGLPPRTHTSSTGVVTTLFTTGETFADPDSTNSPGRAATFIANWSSAMAASPPIGSSAAHEIGHSLTAMTSPEGHYVEPTPVKRLFEPSNLMCVGERAHSGDVASSQRLWDEPDGAGLNQYSTIRSSRYTRGWVP